MARDGEHRQGIAVPHRCSASLGEVLLPAPSTPGSPSVHLSVLRPLGLRRGRALATIPANSASSSPLLPPDPHLQVLTFSSLSGLVSVYSGLGPLGESYFLNSPALNINLFSFKLTEVKRQSLPERLESSSLS